MAKNLMKHRADDLPCPFLKLFGMGKQVDDRLQKKQSPLKFALSIGSYKAENCCTVRYIFCSPMSNIITTRKPPKTNINRAKRDFSLVLRCEFISE